MFHSRYNSSSRGWHCHSDRPQNADHNNLDVCRYCRYRPFRCGSIADGYGHNPNPPLTLAGIAMAGLVIFITARSRVVLCEDGIAVTQFLWPSRRVARTNIVARRTNPANGKIPFYHILITRDGREVNLPSYLEHNAAFRTWLADIPLASGKHLR
jgi:hypothetical protein